MDPDFKAVADAVAVNPLAMAAFSRLVSKSGNVGMMCQMLDYSAEEVGRLHAKVSSLEDGCLEALFDVPAENSIAEAPSTSNDDELACELERAMEQEDGERKREPTTGEMIDYLERPTKMQKTFDRFYQRYGEGEITRSELGKFIGAQPDLLHKSSATKLFRPPKGFGVGLFVRKGSFVKLAKEWINAWEERRAATP